MFHFFGDHRIFVQHGFSSAGLDGGIIGSYKRVMDNLVQNADADGAAPPTTPEALLARLVALGIDAVTHRHPPLHTVEESKALRGELPGGHCKNLFLKDRKGGQWLVVALEDARVDLNRFDKVIGSPRLSFGSPDRLWNALGVRPGSVTPFALINDTDRQVRVVLQKAMLDQAPLNYHPLINEMTTALSPDDLLAFVRACGHEPMIVDFGGEA